MNMMIKSIQLVVLFGLFLQSLPLMAAENQRNKGNTVNSGNTSELVFTDESGTKSLAILLNAKARIEVSGLTAKITLSQTYQNQSRHWVAGKYLLPLPETAAVDSLTIQTADSVITGKIKEKQQAKAIYQQAKKAGKKAAIVESVRPNLFSTQVANIAPQSEVKVVISYVQPVEFVQDEFSLVLPNTLTERYMPRHYTAQEKALSSEVTLHRGGFNSIDVHAPQVSKPSGSHNIQIRAVLDTGFEVDRIMSDHHAITWSEMSSGQYDVQLKEQSIAMNQDFVLRWRAMPSQQPNAAVFAEHFKSDEYINLMIMPPQQVLSHQTLPRETIFVMDSSGSMQGASMRQAKRALRKALSLLAPTDTFNIIDFDSSYDKLFDKAVFATPEHLQQAGRFIDAMHADGGTNINEALHAALGAPSIEGYLKQVIFLTDGAVGNETQILASIRSRLGTNRIFTIGIGHAPNSYFMRKAAEYGRGSFTYINDVNQVEERIGKLFQQLKNPVLKDIQLKFADGTVPEMYPAKIPDLYLGQPINVFIKMPKGAESNTGKSSAHRLHVSGRLLNQSWQRTVEFTQGEQAVGVAKNWGRKKVAHLMDLEILGEPVDQIKSQVLATSLKFGLVSKYTSFVAVEEKISRPENKKLQDKTVPNLNPKGSIHNRIPYPKTSTSAELQVWIGVLFLVAGFLLMRRRKQESLSA